MADHTEDFDAEDESRCFVCRELFRDGDQVYSDETEGLMHAACCGTEHDSFVGPDGEPLKDGDPIPAPFIWHPWPAAFTEMEEPPPSALAPGPAVILTPTPNTSNEGE